jgi:hypothetical protein
MSKIKKIKVEKKPVKTSSMDTIYIRNVTKETKKKFYAVAKESNLLARELFEKLINEAI